MFLSVRCINYSLILIGCFDIVKSLYEDQIGKFDWKLDFIGKLKYSQFDGTNKIILATEENVVAAIGSKSGEIIWRHVLETGLRGRIELLHVDDYETVTISGHNPAVVRGWNSKAGILKWEWSLTVNISDKTSQVWFVKDNILYHIVPIVKSHYEVTLYDLRTGQNNGSTQKVSAPWITERCVLSKSFYICLNTVSDTNTQLMSLDISDEKLLVNSKSLGALSEFAEIHAITGSLPGAIINNRLYIVADGILESNIQLHEGYSVMTIKVNDEEIILHTSPKSDNPEQYRVGSYLALSNELFLIDISFNLPPGVNAASLAASTCVSKKDSGPPKCLTLFATQDDALFLVHQTGAISWTREESLARVADVQMIDLPLSVEEGQENALNQQDEATASWDIVNLFLGRLFSQLRALISLIEVEKPKEEIIRDAFGLRKIIVALTEKNKLFGIDSATGNILWSSNIPAITPFKTGTDHKILVQKTSRNYPYTAQCSILGQELDTENGMLYTFDPITGDTLQTFTMNFKVKQYSLLPEDNTYLKGLLVLDTDNVPHVFPTTSSNLAENMYIYTIDQISKQATGFAMENVAGNLTATIVWKILLAGANHKVTHIAAKNIHEKVQSQGRALGDRSVLYKYVNPNLIAVVTQGTDPVHKYVLNIILVDVVSGVIVFSATHRRAREPIHIVHSENWLVYSYFNEKARRTEIGTMELYEGKTQSNRTYWSSYNAPQPMVERQTFVIPSQVEALRETITGKGITSKHMLIGLSSGSVLELPWMFLDPRRPLTPFNEAREEGILPYLPELPLPSEGMINYNHSITKMRGIHTSPSGLESTCLVLVYGLDMYFTRVAPSETFDLLKDDFDHKMIALVLSSLALVAYVSKYLSNRKALRQAWQ